MVSYDGTIIQQFAARLYREANQTIVAFTVVGGLIGFAGGYYIRESADLTAIAAAALLGFLGYMLGSQRAFALKLQAQIALCQVQIEANTRRA